MPDGYVRELRHFVTAIHTGKPLTEPDAAGAVEICEAEERSIRSGGKVGV